MIIDSHVHLAGEGWIHPEFMLGLARVVSVMMGKDTGEYPDAEELVKNIAPVLYDATGDRLIQAMDAAGVDMSCIFAHDTELALGKTDVPIEEQNRLIAQAAENSPDRLISFFAIDPRWENAVDMFSRAIEEWGMKGLKFLPTSGFYPNHESFYPLYEKCVEYGVPLITHTGSEPAPLKARFARPLYIDDVAADFPGLPIIMAHAAHQLWEEALLVASAKPNIYFDISGWQIVFSRDPSEFYRWLRHLLDAVGPWRVFFGTDGPYLNVLCPLDTWVKALEEPDLSSCPEVSFSRQEIDVVMGNGFARLMGLTT